MKSTARLILAAALALLCAPHPRALAQAAPPSTVDYQGFVLDASGNPLAPDVGGAPAPVNFAMQFKIWDATSGGNLIWAEQQNVTVSAGRFSVQLGNGSAISGLTPQQTQIKNAFGATTRYLGITVIIPPATTGAEIVPRLQFLTTPFAYAAQTAVTSGAVAQTTGSSTLNNTTLSGTTALNGTTTIQSATIQGGTATLSSATINGGSFTGNGSGLTSLNASNIISGTLPAAQIPSLDASKIATGTVADARLSSNVLFTTSPLNASNIASGALSDARLSSNVAMRNAGQSFSGLQTMANGLTVASGGLCVGTTEGLGNNGYIALTGHLTYHNGSGAINWGPGGDLHLRTLRTMGDVTNFDERLIIKSDGSIGIGTYPTRAMLDIAGEAGSAPIPTPHGYLSSTTVGANGSGSANVPLSIYASGTVHASLFRAFSDERIKSVAGFSDGTADLRTLLGLRVTDYTYIDTIAKGTAPQKKLVAQQVEQVFPQAVARTTDVVPDIFQKATIKAGWITLPTNLEKGERVRLIAEDSAGIHEVLEVDADGGRFRTGFASKGSEVFVYGREVNDFRSVDYEAIAMLNVSATQQIKKEKDAEIKTLTDKVAELEKQLEAAKKLAAGQDTRLTTLEARDQARDRKLAALEKVLLDLPKAPAARTASLRRANGAE